MADAATRGPVRIGNCSGFLGDRISAAAELVDSGEIDVLTGDWLAELTMLILARQRLKHGPGSGYARTFLTQMEQVLGTCLDRGITVVSNAGGLDPQGCADALGALAARLGLAPRIGVVTGDDVLRVIASQPSDFPHLDTGDTLDGRAPITANAYLGGEPVTAALAAGADVVITGRITDAALVVGPAAWWHGWSYADAAAGDQLALDRLAGAVAAGHVIECGAQATGGNYSFFAEVPAWPAGFPIAEVAADGSSVITKPAGSGGLVSVDTVTSQLVYEIAGPRYANPDVTALFDTIHLESAGKDRVAITGVRGDRAPERLKVAVNLFAGFRNTMSLVLTGRDARAKADLALQMVAGLRLDEALGDPASGRPAPGAAALAAASTLDVAALDVAFEDVAASDPATTAAAQGHLRITVKDLDQRKVGKPFTTAVVESALGCYPGMFPTAPPGEGSAFGIYWPTLIDRTAVRVAIEVDGAPVAFAPGEPGPDAPDVTARPPGEAVRPGEAVGPGETVEPNSPVESPAGAPDDAEAVDPGAGGTGTDSGVDPAASSSGSAPFPGPRGTRWLPPGLPSPARFSVTSSEHAPGTRGATPTSGSGSPNRVSVPAPVSMQTRWPLDTRGWLRG